MANEKDHLQHKALTLVPYLCYVHLFWVHISNLWTCSSNQSSNGLRPCRTYSSTIWAFFNTKYILMYIILCDMNNNWWSYSLQVPYGFSLSICSGGLAHVRQTLHNWVINNELHFLVFPFTYVAHAIVFFISRLSDAIH